MQAAFQRRHSCGVPCKGWGGPPMLKYRSIAVWTAVVAAIVLLTGLSIWQQ
jgi:hypothetical protein